MPLPFLEGKDGRQAVHLTITRAEAELIRRGLITFAHHLDEPSRTRVAALALRFKALARQPQEAQS